MRPIVTGARFFLDPVSQENADAGDFIMVKYNDTPLELWERVLERRPLVVPFGEVQVAIHPGQINNSDVWLRVVAVICGEVRAELTPQQQHVIRFIAALAVRGCCARNGIPIRALGAHVEENFRELDAMPCPSWWHPESGDATRH